MPTVKETMKRLAIAFTARDIMIPRRELVCAESESEAEVVSQTNPDFSIIPIRRKGKVGGYFERDTHSVKEIALSDLISDGTSLLNLVDIFKDRQFCFILSHRQIAGYVHFSDLNHHLVKLTFYVILEALERKLLNSIQREDDTDYLHRNLDPRRFEQIAKQYKRHGDAARNLFNYLNISDILQLAVKANKVRMDSETIRAAKRFRDGAAHPSLNLVANYHEVKKLVTVKRECLRILGRA
jgi:hypothetical protein